MCNIWQKYREDPEKYKQELTVEETRRVFEKSQLLKQLQLLIIAGGEPFLKKDFVDMILLFFELNPSLRILIASNGQRSDMIEEKLKTIRRVLGNINMREYVLLVGIALDGMKEAHDRIRGLNGSFERALDTIERIKRIERIHVGIQFTFTPQNYGEFTAVHTLSKQLDIPLNFQFAQVSDHYYGNREQQYAWTDEQLTEVRDMLFGTGYFDIIRTDFLGNEEYSGSLTKRILNYNPFFLEYILDYHRNPKRSIQCFSGTHSGFLDPYGNVYPCIMLEKSFGNIREESFDSLWKSSGARQVRDSIARRECHCCSFCDIPHSIQRNWRIIPWNMRNIFFPDK
jgi:MoaA/NifB/PqqE/SkfB family radical SAM enzyme